MNDFFDGYSEKLRSIKSQSPLVHHITNFVTMQDCANMTVAIGASPVMAFCVNEVEEIARSAKAVVLNTGTPDDVRFEAVLKAGASANKENIPVILDPVGVGATIFRKNEINKILNEIKVDVIKGNASEIKELAGIHIENSKCIDSIETVDKDLERAVSNLALRYGCVVALTGEFDIITDGKRMCKIERGSRLLSDISGSGCMSASLIGSFCAVEKDYFKACIYGILTMNVAGENAEMVLSDTDGVGTFKTKLFDFVYNMYKIDLKKREGINFV